MDYLELDKKMISLKEKYEMLDDEYDGITYEIESLEYQQQELEDEMDCINTQMEKVKQQQHTIKIKSINNTFTGDRFTDDFIIASLFCRQGFTGNETLRYVSIKRDRLIACDGHKAIIIKNNDIPKELIDTQIKWDVRGDFKNNIKDEHFEYPDIPNIFDDARKDNKLIAKYVKYDEFCSRFNIEKPSQVDSNETIRMEYSGVKVALNTFYLDTALEVLKDRTFQVSIKDSISPVLFEDDEISIIVLPVRVF